ncbi:phospholipase [Salipaludibacillus agaradhaerens]|uniref:Phospholipase n=1 Tax=Salipaludibacillus agaradhaerens TaxID=76935 RepID=A0A9Q4B2C7_SALAG|nr:phospholipase D family protein [Salipaludibacillus agaradhaerens]MCR6097133.1 phospholipase [Salipaludibacillus agaradhaerens]MCR6113382.1 phospholipase [Salipaludibacillus agaradhaerens]
MPHVTLKTKPKHRVLKKITFTSIILYVMLTIGFAIYGYVKPLPDNISIEGTVYETNHVDFLYDLTYRTEEGKEQQEHVIFDTMHDMISDAEEFIIVDMFLFNDDYPRDDELYPPLSSSLAEALIQKLQESPETTIIVITDPINTFYGSYTPDHIKDMKNAGITVILTDLTELRDSNPTFSGIWRSTFQWFGHSENGGWLPNAFSPDSPDVTLRSYLELINFKANHRKIMITEKKGIVSSANAHDASANHSNIAFTVQGDIINDLIATEKAVAVMSGVDPTIFDEMRAETPDGEIDLEEDHYELQLLTEGKIKEHILLELEKASKGDIVNIGMFYLSDRDIISHLLKASERGVTINIILDANKDAFGHEKNGVPNRPVAYELIEESGGHINIRWYHTVGEQYHAKFVYIEKQDEAVMIGGSANLTKRNIDDINLETNIKVTGSPNSDFMLDVSHYFDRLWVNEDGLYTVDYDTLADESRIKKWMYLFQEWSGLSSF